ncbi:hypothetical protein H9P43_001857 [Blastocladiella emersonii ATCC 22665]|nr:hypothetical protein H9P43_001857 [Blastocladiella emersonii ATCC 22665]
MEELASAAARVALLPHAAESAADTAAAVGAAVSEAASASGLVASDSAAAALPAATAPMTHAMHSAAAAASSFNPSLLSFITSRTVVFLAIQSVIAGRIREVAAPRQPRKLPVWANLAMRLPLIVLLATNAYTLWTMVVDSSLGAAWGLAPLHAKWIGAAIAPGSTATSPAAISDVLFNCFRLFCVAACVDVYVDCLETGRASEQHNLVEWGLVTYLHPRGPDICLVVLLQTVEIVLLQTMGLFGLERKYRLVPTTVTGLVSMAHFVLRFKSPLYPSMVALAKWPELFSLFITAVVLAIYAATVVITGGRMRQRPATPTRAMLPALSDAYSFAVFKLAGAMLDASGSAPLRNEDTPILLARLPPRTLPSGQLAPLSPLSPAAAAAATAHVNPFLRYDASAGAHATSRQVDSSIRGKLRALTRLFRMDLAYDTLVVRLIDRIRRIGALQRLWARAFPSRAVPAAALAVNTTTDADAAATKPHWSHAAAAAAASNPDSAYVNDTHLLAPPNTAVASIDMDDEEVLGNCGDDTLVLDDDDGALQLTVRPSDALIFEESNDQAIAAAAVVAAAANTPPGPLTTTAVYLLQGELDPAEDSDFDEVEYPDEDAEVFDDEEGEDLCREVVMLVADHQVPVPTMCGTQAAAAASSSNRPLTRSASLLTSSPRAALQAAMDQGAHLPPAAPWDEDSLHLTTSTPACVVCQAQPRSIVLRPCNCLVVCDDCREDLAHNRYTTCPTCRRTVQSYSKIYEP